MALKAQTDHRRRYRVSRQRLALHQTGIPEKSLILRPELLSQVQPRQRDKNL